MRKAAQKTTPKEGGIALQALLRREELEPQARIELYERIASHFKTLAEFPKETTYGITGEQYLRNVVEILYSSKKKQYQNSRATALLTHSEFRQKAGRLQRKQCGHGSDQNSFVLGMVKQNVEPFCWVAIPPESVAVPFNDTLTYGKTMPVPEYCSRVCSR